MKGAQHSIVEVSASSAPKDIIGAVVSTPPKAPSFGGLKWFHLAFVFMLVFAVIIYFREEVYTFSKDVSKHPILAAVENQQLHKYLGMNWQFGSGPKEDVEMMVDAPPNVTLPGVNTTAT